MVQPKKTHSNSSQGWGQYMPRNNADKLSQVNGDGNDNRSHYSEGVCRHPRGFGDGLRVLSSDDYESLSRYGGAPQVEGSSEKRTTPTGTKLSKRISTAFLTYTTILSAPRDPDSMSRGFDLRLEGSTGRADHTICWWFPSPAWMLRNCRSLSGLPAQWSVSEQAPV